MFYLFGLPLPIEVEKLLIKLIVVLLHKTGIPFTHLKNLTKKDMTITVEGKSFTIKGTPGKNFPIPDLVTKSVSKFWAYKGNITGISVRASEHESKYINLLRDFGDMEKEKKMLIVDVKISDQLERLKALVSDICVEDKLHKKKLKEELDVLSSKSDQHIASFTSRIKVCNKRNAKIQDKNSFALLAELGEVSNIGCSSCPLIEPPSDPILPGFIRPTKQEQQKHVGKSSLSSSVKTTSPVRNQQMTPAISETFVESNKLKTSNFVKNDVMKQGLEEMLTLSHLKRQTMAVNKQNLDKVLAVSEGKFIKNDDWDKLLTIIDSVSDYLKSIPSKQDKKYTETPLYKYVKENCKASPGCKKNAFEVSEIQACGLTGMDKEEFYAIGLFELEEKTKTILISY